jgi:hypothetical protein
MNLLRSPRSLAPLAAVLVLSQVGAAAAAPAPATTPAAQATPKAKKRPPIFDPDVLGTKAIEAGVEICNKTSRRPFVIFGTNDCEPCRTFNDALYEPAFFEAFIKQFVPILIDASPGGPNVQLLKNYGIDASKGFPAVGIFELDQTPPAITRSGELAAVSKTGARAVQEWILGRFKKDPPEEK